MSLTIDKIKSRKSFNLLSSELAKVSNPNWSGRNMDSVQKLTLSRLVYYWYYTLSSLIFITWVSCVLLRIVIKMYSFLLQPPFTNSC